MNMHRAYLFLWCAAVGICAFLILDYHQGRNASDQKRFEQWWADDVASLEASPKLPKPWFQVSEVEVFGGTPASKAWLREIQIPIHQKNPKGQFKLEALVVPWEENGNTGVMVQYNLVDLKSKNMIFELGRTMVLSEQKSLALVPTSGNPPSAKTEIPK